MRPRPEGLGEQGEALPEVPLAMRETKLLIAEPCLARGLAGEVARTGESTLLFNKISHIVFCGQVLWGQLP